MDELEAQSTSQSEKINKINGKTLKRKNNNMEQSKNNKQYKTNYFALLDSDDDYDETLYEQYESYVKNSQERVRNKQVNNKNKEDHSDKPTSSENNNITKDNIKESIKTNQKIPPINILDVETKPLIDFIKNCLKISDFKIKEFRDKKCLYLNKIDSYVKVRNYLEKSKTKFFTYTPKELKTKTLLLKGLDANNSTDEILEHLCLHQNDELTFLKVSLFTTKKIRPGGI